MEIDDGMTRATLSTQELGRYSRHVLLPEVGLGGQMKLKASSVLIVGAGGLGSPLALYLAAAGVGHLGMVDFDVVDVTNLQRQILHGTSDVGRSKLDSAAARIREVNPHVEVTLHETVLTSENALDLLARYDVVADGTDNFPTRYLVNDASVLTGVPNVYASIFRFDGQVSVFGTKGGPCYRCLFPEPPPPGLVPSCAEGGVLGVLPGIVGTIQATEVLKQLLGIGEPLVGRLLLFDALAMRFTALEVRRDPDCPVCGDRPTQTGLIDYEQFCGIPVDGEDAVDVPQILVSELKDRLDRGEDLLLLDVRRREETAIASIGGLLIPLDELESRMAELEAHRSRDIVVTCRTGVRSSHAVRTLERHGFLGARNLAGGIRAWSEQIDSTVPVY